MKSTELRLAGLLLEMAADHFGDHCCNDWNWPGWVTMEERKRILHDMEMHNSGDAEEAKETVEMCAEDGPPDWWIMAYLGTRLQEESHG